MQPTWQHFIDRYAQVVLDAALRVLTHATDAEDVAQDVFLEILRTDRLGQLFEQPALVRTIATRRALDRLRQRRSHEPLDGRDVNGRGHEASEYLIAAELEDRVRREIVRLPPREAEVFCLVFFESLAQCDIAKALGIPVGAVAKSLCNARKKLSVAFAGPHLDRKS